MTNKNKSQREIRVENAISQSKKTKKYKIIRNTIFWFIVIGIMIFIAGNANASTPAYEIHNNLDNDVYTGDSEVGDLVFTKESYVPDYFNRTSIDNFSGQQHDILRWLGNNSINIVNPSNQSEIIVSGSQYVFLTVGDYFYSQLSNTSNNETITISEEDILEIGLDISNFKLSFDYDDSFLLSDEKVIEVSTNIGTSLEPGDYDALIVVSSDFQNENVTHTFNLIADSTWSIVENSLNSTVSIDAGKYQNVGFFKIANNGNINVEVETSVTGNGSSFVQIQDSQTIYKGSYSFYSVALQVPSVQKDGDYDVTIIFESDNKTISIPLNIIIKDLIKPEIIDVSFKESFVWRSNEVKVEAKDNIGLKHATISFDGVDHNMTMDQQFFFYKDTFKKFNNYSFNICVYDTSENSVCENTTKEFSKLSIIDAFNSGTAPPKKTGKFSKSLLLNLSEKPPEPLKLTLMDFTSEFSDVNLFDIFNMRIIDGDGATTNFVRMNQTLEIYEAGDIYLEVRSQNITEYSIMIDVETPDYMENFSTITISGEFRDYDIPESFEMDWFGGTLICDVIDTGEIEDSKIVCPLEFPITTSIESLAIPVTTGEMGLMNDNIANLKSSMSKRTFVMGLIVVLLGFVIGGILFILWFATMVYPYTRFRFGGNDD